MPHLGHLGGDEYSMHLAHFGREKSADTTSKLFRHSPIRHAAKLISYLTGSCLSPSGQSEWVRRS
jgi:hypothetical protein